MIMKGFYLKKLFSFTLIFLMTSSLFGQRRDLSGQVRDEEGRPLERVTVKSAHQATTTSSQGTFQLEKQEVGQEVTFSAMGYLEQTLTIPAARAASTRAPRRRRPPPTRRWFFLENRSVFRRFFYFCFFIDRFISLV